MVEGAAPSGDPDLEALVRDGRALFERTFQAAPAVVASAPGRINVIGEHTDYNDGLAMPGAIDRWAIVAVSPAADDRVEVYSEAFGERAAAPAPGLAASVEGSRGWSRLPLGVALMFAEAVVRARVNRQPGRTGTQRGFRATISGNLPLGAGLSSSAAVEVAMLNALRRLFEVELDDRALILTAQQVEHRCLGVATGLLDQYTAQLSRAGSLMVIDFAAATHEYVDADLGAWSWVLIDSKVRHEIAASAYGDRVRETRAALDRVARVRDDVASFRDLEVGHLGAVDDDVLRRRLRHYIAENKRVRDAAAALAAGDIAALGALMFASHESLRDDYLVSCPELDVLVDAARRSHHCVGARMMGGGFGGCTLNLVRAGKAADFAAQVSPEFERRFGYLPDTGVYRLVGGARVDR